MSSNMFDLEKYIAEFLKKQQDDPLRRAMRHLQVWQRPRHPYIKVPDLLDITKHKIIGNEHKLEVATQIQPLTYILNNLISRTFAHQTYFSGDRHKLLTDEHRKYTNYTSVAPKQVANGITWYPFSATGTKIKGGFTFELRAKDPGIAFDIEYDGNHIQIPAADLQTDGIPTFTAIHNQGGYNEHFTETRWDTTNNIYAVQLTRMIWFNDYLTVAISNATGSDHWVWLNMDMPAIDNYYDKDNETS